MLDYMIVIGTIATPILVLVLTAVGWKYRQSIERKIRLEERLRDDRISIYNQVLEPFIILLMSESAWLSDKRNRGKNKNQAATAMMMALDYRKASFKLLLLGSDPVVKAFNNLMQHFYGRRDSDQYSPNGQETMAMSLLGGFLLEIRRSMGNESTRLDNWDMLEWFRTDARKHRQNAIELGMVARPSGRDRTSR